MKKYRFIIPIIILFLGITIGSSFLINKVKINYDSSVYLSEQSVTKKTLAIMEEEFGSSGSLSIMVSGAPSELIDELMIDNVKAITTKTVDEFTLYQFQLSVNDYSDEALGVIETLDAKLNDANYEYYMVGQAYLVRQYIDMVSKQIPKMIILIIPIALIILLLMTQTFLSPLLIIIVLASAIVINMGTNVMFSSISYITYSICAILQFAVCMDYSIMLMHSYHQHRKKEINKYIAMRQALKKSWLPIVASGVTTMSGFVALMFMNYTIGLDIGLVLVKGIVISLIVVLVLLPSLILLFDKLLLKTYHRSIIEVIKKQPKVKKRLPVLIIALILIGASAFVQINAKYVYGDNSAVREIPEIKNNYEQIEKHFAINQNVVILIPKEEQLNDLITKISLLDQEVFEGAIAYQQQMTPQEIKLLLNDISDSELGLLFQGKETTSIEEIVNLIKTLKQPLKQEEMAYFIKQLANIDFDFTVFYQLQNVEKMSVIELLNFLTIERTSAENTKIITNIFPEVPFVFTDGNLLSCFLTIEEGVNRGLTFQEAQIMLEKMIPENLLMMLYADKETLSLKEILNSPHLQTEAEVVALNQKIALFETFSSYIPLFSAINIDIDEGALVNTFIGKNYQRIILEVSLEEENEQSLAYFTKLDLLLKETYDEYYIASPTSSVLDIKDSSKYDYLITTIISVILVSLILLITFRKPLIVLILLILIEGAIFITMAIQSFYGDSIVFTGFVIVSCIQLGSTIDYGILFTSKYLDNSKEGKEDSIEDAFTNSLPSIITSGSILAGAGFVLMIATEIPMIAKMGRLIGYGGIMSMLMILLILPQLLLYRDKNKKKKQIQK